MTLNATRRIAGAAAGAALAVAYAWGTGIAFNAHSREWDMGGIPLLLASWAFVGFLAGVVAALIAPRRPYLSALLAAGFLFLASLLLTSFTERLTPGMTQTERREYWSNTLGLLSPGGVGFQIPFALWGALVVDPFPSGRATRLVPLRDLSYAPGWLLSFFALLGIGIHFVPRFGGYAAALLPAAFFLWVARRNRQTRGNLQAASPVR